jgi:ribonuclease BN (tRNA processing enzyme)
MFQAIDKGHSTSEMVGLFCSSMKSPPAAVVLTHISPRYSADSDAASKSTDGHNTATKIGTDQLLEECSAALNRPATRVLMAHDMLVLDATRQFAAVPTPDPASVTM